MYLKSIEIQGFKSFANKTVFKFHNGITGIVGPNGSGKSNVADAVRWVLGEQRVKQLRGGNMQDVIFAGTQQRKPLGYAYVSITLNNEDHFLPLSFDEVTVSRRLYRSGESEYLLNGTQCRLKDVNELFYDTGIGKEGYSIIGQGQIEKILSGKPEERRELFDEAAGIVKYKRRKLEATKKLDDEQQNLARVNDILSELQRQVGPMERQAEKAKQYLRLKEDLKVYDVNVFLADYKENKDQLQKLTQTRTDTEAELDSVNSETEKIRQQYAHTEEELQKNADAQSQAQEQLTSGRLLVQQKNGMIDVLKEQIRAGEQSLKQHSERLQNIEEEGLRKTEAVQESSRSLEQAGRQCQEMTLKEEAVSSKQDETSSRIAEFNHSIDECGAAILELLNARAGLKSEQQRINTLIDQNKLRRGTLNAQILKLRSEASGQKEELENADRKLQDVSEKIEDLKTQNDAASRELDEVQSRLLEDSQKMEKNQAEYHAQAARLDTLRNMAERYDGYGSSIRKVMEKKTAEKGIHGVVADLIRTDRKYETAVETALGGTIQNIVTDNEETAKRMISYLKENKLGRATFLPLTAMTHAAGLRQNEVLQEPGVIGLAGDLVQTEKIYAGLVRYLLGKTVVVDEISHAIALARKFRYSMRIVTLEGELISPGGSMTGGAFRNSSNLLGRRREINELTEAAAAGKKALDDLRDRIDSTRASRNRLRDQIRDLGAQLQELYLQQNTLQMSRREIASRQNATDENSRSFHSESRQLQQTLIRLQADQADIEMKIGDSEEEERRLNDVLEEARNGLKKEQEKLDEYRRQLEVLHLEKAALEEKENYLTQEKNRILQELAQLDREKKQLSQESAGAADIRQEKNRQIEQIGEEIRSTTEQIAAEEKNLALLSGDRDRLTSAQKKFFDRREELTQQSTLLDRERYRLTSQIEKLEESSENSISYMWDEYGLTYSTALPLSRDDLGGRAQWKKKMSDLKVQIRDLGNVNVNAIEEYKEIYERYSFLTGQQEDLVKAEGDLRKIIAELDKGMRERFSEQFTRISEEFDKAFGQLFGGGKGTLELVEDEDILETGIRIIAQPPGKKLQNMMQLSGGEKALTAIALLFAIQNLKPSPFCLLDEIEAALDENNVDRYARYLRKLTKNTQFIIITHRRGTMAAADRLYGITMQEKGVSAQVSVNLIENELDN